MEAKIKDLVELPAGSYSAYWGGWEVTIKTNCNANGLKFETLDKGIRCPRCAATLIVDNFGNAIVRTLN
jgi:hypothetical protein